MLPRYPRSSVKPLVALYNSTNGPGWTGQHQLAGDQHAQKLWTGVGVISGHVKEAYLGYNQLNGSIPPELGTQTNFTRPRLDNNQLSGIIPP